ncbi:MAG: epoxyqueuosine reductase QueH [Clostridia bacterium]|nr:epoxyqueuosine reductase QueH [Clostridia bacterium]
MRLLLHICCAPCSIYCIETLRREGVEPVGFWFNPNIHPFTEYRARKTALEEYSRSIDLELAEFGEYGLRDFLGGIASFEERCAFCYETRLSQTAKYAAQNGFDAFSTTLLISPYQNHGLLREVGERAGRENGIDFLYRDFRPGFREGQQKARELGLYMQKYCGCVFSEEERYDRRYRKKPAQKPSN